MHGDSAAAASIRRTVRWTCCVRGACAGVLCTESQVCSLTWTSPGTNGCSLLASLSPRERPDLWARTIYVCERTCAAGRSHKCFVRLRNFCATRIRKLQPIEEIRNGA